MGKKETSENAEQKLTRKGGIRWGVQQEGERREGGASETQPERRY